MIKKILIVDDDQEMLLAFKEGMEKYDDTFNVLMAQDGMVAIEKLKHTTISLVVTDLKMPFMDGFSLLAYIMSNYPEIPVIIITGYSTPEMKQLAQKGGAVGYIEKPFLINELAQQIIQTLRKEADGGTLHNISSAIFLQLIEMEQKTCTIRIHDNHSNQQGILFFKEGELLDARLDSYHGEQAAYRIFGWDDVNISIHYGCEQKERKIQKDLQAILLEAMRLKDESGKEKQPDQAFETIEASKTSEKGEPVECSRPESLTPVHRLTETLKNAIGGRYDMDDIYQDNSWDGFIVQMNKIGHFLEAGDVKICYVDKGESNDFILIPGEKTTIVNVNPKFPRDRIMQALMI
jgi:CheY-like chemotaxis protein